MYILKEKDLSIYPLSYLPSYASYLLQHRLKEFAALQLQLSRELQLPLLASFEKYSDEKLLDLFTQSSETYLSSLAQNAIKPFIDDIQNKWQANQLPLIDKYTITTKDITIGNYIRKTVLTHFIPEYTKDAAQIVALINEIDQVLLYSETLSSQTYTHLLQQKLEEQSYLTNSIINTTPCLIYLFNLKTFTIDFVNERTEDFFNLSNTDFKELGDKALSLLIHPDDLPSTVDFLHDLSTIKDGEVRVAEYRLRNKQGEYVWMRNYVSLFKTNDQGQPEFITGNVLNINAEKQATEQLLEAQEVAGMGSFDWDISSENTKVSDQLLKILGMDGLTNMNVFMQKVHPADREKVTKSVTEAINQTGIFECEYRYLGDNKEKVIWSRGKVIYKDGAAIKIRGTIMDVTERNQMLEQLRKSEELYKQAQALSHIGHFTLQLKTSQITFTEELNRIYGLDTKDQVFDYNEIIKMRDPDDANNIREKIKRTITTHEPFDFYYKIIAKNGVKKTLHALGKGVFNEAGEMVQLVGTVQDVTEHQKLVQQLQKSEWLYKRAEVLANIGNWNWDVKTNKLEWSDQLYKIYGLSPQSEEASIERFLSFIHPDDRPAIEEEINKGYPNDYVDTSFRIITDKGDVKIIRSIGLVQRDADKNIINVIGAEQDITEHQQLISQLKQSESLYKQAQELAHVGNWSWRMDEEEIIWSDEMYRIFGLEPQSEPVTIQTYISFVHPEDSNTLREKVQTAIQTGESWNLIHRIVWQDGSQHYLNATGEVLRNEQGAPYLMIGTAQDVTQQQEYEKQLSEQQHFIQKIADATPSIIAAYNIHTGKYIFINETIRKILGYRPQQVLEEGVSFL